jgi:hypothetical protein
MTADFQIVTKSIFHLLSLSIAKFQKNNNGHAFLDMPVA